MTARWRTLNSRHYAAKWRAASAARLGAGVPNLVWTYGGGAAGAPWSRVHERVASGFRNALDVGILTCCFLPCCRHYHCSLRMSLKDRCYIPSVPLYLSPGLWTSSHLHTWHIHSAFLTFLNHSPSGANSSAMATSRAAARLTATRRARDAASSLRAPPRLPSSSAVTAARRARRAPAVARHAGAGRRRAVGRPTRELHLFTLHTRACAALHLPARISPAGGHLFTTNFSSIADWRSAHTINIPL